MKCSSVNITSLPPTVPINTTWVTLLKSSITKLCEDVEYLRTIKALDVRNNKVSFIRESFANLLMGNRNDSADKYQLDKIWLSHNPYHCDCEMTWMMKWLNTYTTPSGQHVVVDYNKLICESGLMKGRVISTLTAVEMGCFPRELTVLQKVGIAIGAGVALVMIGVLLFIIARRSRKVQFFLFNTFNLNTITDDKHEDIDKFRYDAFFCFW